MLTALTAVPIPAFDDNYLWLIHGPNHTAVIVDPGDAQPVMDYLRKQQLELIAILVTHHHNDHIGGINTLTQYWDIPVYGPSSPHIPQVTHTVGDGDTVTLFNESHRFDVMTVPGHTLDHIAYEATINNQPAVFCGDTLFAAGCGRIFDGSSALLYQSLQRLNQLPAETLIFCTHEYTLANLAFAQAVEPHNQDILERIETESAKRQQGQPTLPSQLSLERATNPFLRCNTSDVKTAINAHFNSNESNQEALFIQLRRWKDHF